MDFENLGLKIGDVLQLEISSQPGSRFPVRLIGIHSKKGFITSSPLNQEGKFIFIKKDQAVVIRFATLTNVSAFNTKVLEDKTTPYPHLHLAIPPHIESIEVRQAFRINIQLPVTIINEDTESKPVSMTITDLSPMGARVEGQVEIASKGDLVSTTMQLDVAGNQYTVSVTGKVMAKGINYVADKETSEEVQQGLYFGLKFEEIDHEDAAPLYAFVYHEMLQKLQAVN